MSGIQETRGLDERIQLGSHGAFPLPAESSPYTDQTFCARGYTPFEAKTGAVVPPIFLSATYSHPQLGQSTGFDYGRCLNPTRLELERTLASLEKASYALAFSSGMAAISCLAKLFSPGDEVIVSNDLYGGTYRLFSLYQKYGITFYYTDTSFPDNVKRLLSEHTKALFIETPSNPMMKITDIALCADLVHKNRRDALLIVDNTFLSPVFQNPVPLGADIVVHSGTKFLSGHHDALAGFLVYSTKELDEILRTVQISEGAVLSPFDSYLLLRGIKTLFIRMKQCQQNALRVVDFLFSHTAVEKVFHPSLAVGYERDVSQRQSRGTGAMVSFYLKDAAKVPDVLKRLKLILFAESLGGVQTLITYPIVQTHASIPESMRREVGVDERLLRLSVGIEDVDELIADLAQALA